MNILILSDDKNIFNPYSKAFSDIGRCAEGVDTLHVIISTSKKDPYVFNKVSDKLFLYPTCSSSRFFIRRNIFNIIKSNLTWKSQLIAHLIVAQDSFLLARVAYELSKQYKRNFLITVYENELLTYGTKNFFTKRLSAKLLDHIYAHTSAIKVETQIQGEIISSHNHSLEKKIYILPFLQRTAPAEKEHTQPTTQIDLHKQFPQFNIIILAVIPSLHIQDLKKAKLIMVELHNRYPKMGLVIVTEKKNFSRYSLFTPSLPPYIVTIEDRSHNDSYFENSTVFIDLGGDSHEVSPLMKAIHAGCVAVVAYTKENSEIIRDGENGFIVDAKKPNLFARKIMEVLETPGLRQRMRLYRYDITDLYGTNLEDYYARLLTMWKACGTPENLMYIDTPSTPTVFQPLILTTNPEPLLTSSETSANVPTSDTLSYYPAFTLDIVKKAFKRFEKNTQTKHSHINAFPQNEVFDVDSVQLGIQQALKEITVHPDIQRDEEKKEWGPDIEIMK